jgi:hypothetical protein
MSLFHPMTQRLIITAIALLLAGCEIPGMEPDPRIAKREADAKAIGSACRHGLRSIEDCYSLNEDASKADIFSGWTDMDQYRRENKTEGVRASVGKTDPEEETVVEEKPSKADARASAKSTTKPAAKAAAH